MNSVLAAALAAHPELPPPDAQFEAFVRERGEGPEPGGVEVGDLFVAYHAARGEAAAVAAVRVLLSGLRGALKKTGASEALVDEVLAELPADLVAPRAGAAPRIAGYSGRGPLGGWLRVVAVRAIVERRKREPRPAREVDTYAEAAALHDPELELLRRTYAEKIESALARAFGSLPEDQQLLLRQHHTDGLSIDRLAVMHGIHRATAARRVAAARESLAREVRGLLTRELRIGEQTFDSIFRLVKSEISVHLSRYAR